MDNNMQESIKKLSLIIEEAQKIISELVGNVKPTKEEYMNMSQEDRMKNDMQETGANKQE